MGLGPQALKRNVLLLRYGTSKLVPFPFVRFLIQCFCCVTARVKLVPFPFVRFLIQSRTSGAKAQCASAALRHE
jgi:hypothetical protein